MTWQSEASYDVGIRPVGSRKRRQIRGKTCSGEKCLDLAKVERQRKRRVAPSLGEDPSSRKKIKTSSTESQPTPGPAVPPEEPVVVAAAAAAERPLEHKHR